MDTDEKVEEFEKKILDTAIKKNIEHLLVLQTKDPEVEDIQILLNRLSIFIKIIEKGNSDTKPWKVIIKILEYLNCYEEILGFVRQFMLYFNNDIPENIARILNEKTFFKTSLTEKHIFNICCNEILNLVNPNYIYSDLLIKLWKNFGKTYNVFMKHVVIPTYASIYISPKSVENRIIAICIPTFSGTMKNLEAEENLNYDETKIEKLDKIHKGLESKCSKNFFITKDNIEVFSCMYNDCLKMVEYLQIFENTHSVFYIVSNKNKKYSDISQLKKENGMVYILHPEKIMIINKMLFRWCFNLIDKKNEHQTIDYEYACYASNINTVISNI